MEGVGGAVAVGVNEGRLATGPGAVIGEGPEFGSTGPCPAAEVWPDEGVGPAAQAVLALSLSQDGFDSSGLT
ncbi:hypothetical protein AD006_32295 (plasmid) [Pseudonocardia sp. EC080610-09]|nr:hypothetical protein AD006_32295 [Pseudonocardia sp. EC080610-09]